MDASATYSPDLSRVRVYVTSISADSLTIERSVDEVRWEVIRGGRDIPVGSSAVFDDYEFAPGVTNFYRVTGDDSSTDTTSVTPDLAEAWLKIPAAPFLNRKVRLIGWDGIQREARSGVFDVQSRRTPIVVTDVHSSRSTTIRLRTTTLEERDTLDTILSAGKAILVHMPAGSVFPSMYVVPGAYTIDRPAQRTSVSVFSIPVREVAKPNPSVVGSAGTWQTVYNEFASWADVLTGNDDWLAVSELIGSPNDIIVT